MTSSSPAHQPSDGLFPVGRPTPLGTYLRDLWARRDYIVRVPLNELRSQNAHTLLGGIWLVLNPLLQVGVYFLVFGVIMPIDRGVDSYLVFLTIGVFTFHYSQRVISDGARSVVSSMGLIRTLRFPRATLPLSNSVGQAVAFGPVFVVMLVVVFAHGNAPTMRWLPTQERKFLPLSQDSIPKNLIIRLSNAKNDTKPGRAWDHWSTVVTTPRAGHVCSAPDQGNVCGSCRACWSKDVKEVQYRIH